MVFIQDAPALLINLPIVITFIAAVRYVVGFKTWKNYPVLALALSFFFFYQSTASLLATIANWVLFLTVTFISAASAKYLLRKQKVNYYSRIALLYLSATVASLFTLAVLKFADPSAAYLSTTTAALGVILIGSTVEELASLHFKKDLQEFGRRLATTVVLAFISGLLITFESWNIFIVRHQEILLITLIIDIVLTSWTALRLTELARFSSIIRNQK